MIGSPSKKDYISFVKKEYIPLCKERVVANGHINDVADELTISDEDLELLLSEFQVSLLLKEFRTKKDYCDAIAQVAKDMLSLGRSFEDDAIVVDFANYLANRECIYLEA